MGKTLVIAEKPSVASDIAKALGGFNKEKDYFENDDYVVSSAVGHLLEICVPPDEEVKRGKWTFKHLPMIPSHFDLQPIEKSEARLKLIRRLIRRKDVETIINACDAGREGELIFRYIVQNSKTKKPIRRLWLQSMTPAAIREGFDKLRSDEDMQPLAAAAVCRSEADWIVGINGTRAMTAFNSKSGGFQLTTVGRVQTPTLAIVVEREEAIKKFKPRTYHEIHGTFKGDAGTYDGRWFDESFKKSKDKDADPDRRAERLWDLERAQSIRDRCQGKPGEVTEESKPKSTMCPLLYDLTSLQREANGRFGFAAATTLKIAQALYERHKVLTYPRTDSRALPEDYIGTVKATLRTLSDITGYSTPADNVLKNDWVRPNKRIFNNARISDHFAIIPTSLAPKKLNEMETKIYDLVTKRFLAIFHPAAEYRVTTRITRVEGEPFKTEGRVLVNPGWLAVYGKEASGEADSLAAVKEGEQVQTEAVEVETLETRPPARFTEATLLSSMEGAGKLVDDEELRSAMSEKGLGTPATRAAIIEGLLKEKYLVRQGKELMPTGKALSLMVLLRGLDIPELRSPELTGEWEYKLKQMERDELPRDEFMDQIRQITRRMVDQAKQYESDTVPGDFGTLNNPCPKCGGEIRENYKKFQCQKCDFFVWRILAGRQFELDEMETLVEQKSVGPLQAFRSKMGRAFAAIIKLNDNHEAEFDFGNNNEKNGADAEPVDFSGQEALGKCPSCQANVYEHGMAYVCEKSVGPDRKCRFRSGKIILQREIERDQVRKLLATGKTDLLHRFISKKGRPFSAFLIAKDDGTVGFEFQPRGAKKIAAPKKAAEPSSAQSNAPE